MYFSGINFSEHRSLFPTSCTVKGLMLLRASATNPSHFQGATVPENVYILSLNNGKMFIYWCHPLIG